MELMPSTEQQELAASAAEYLANEVPISRVRELAKSSSDGLIDAVMWSEWASMGFFSVGISETAGGLGLGLVEESLLVHQFGRHLTPGPLVPSIVAAHVAHAAGLEKLTTELVGGIARAGIRVGDIGYDAASEGIVLAVSRHGAELHVVRESMPLPSIDSSTKISRLGLGACVAEVHDELLQARRWVLQAAMLLGLAEAAQEQSTSYAKIRHQFGQPIGGFQAVKHRCVDMVVRTYVASAQIQLAALFVAERRVDARFQAASALTLALDAARSNTVVNVQNHGGIGFTAEHNAGMLVTRMVALESAAGPETDRLEAIVLPTRTIFGWEA